MWANNSHNCPALRYSPSLFKKIKKKEPIGKRLIEFIESRVFYSSYPFLIVTLTPVSHYVCYNFGLESLNFPNCPSIYKLSPTVKDTINSLNCLQILELLCNYFGLFVCLSVEPFVEFQRPVYNLTSLAAGCLNSSYNSSMVCQQCSKDN